MSEPTQITTTGKSTRDIVRERAAEDRAAKEEEKRQAAEERKAAKQAKKEAVKQERREAGITGLAGLTKALGKASWGIKLAKAFNPQLELNARNRVKVGVRVRPMNETETRRGDKDKIGDFMDMEFNTANVTLTNPRPAPGQESKPNYFAFDQLYGPNDTTERVFAELAQPLVELLVAGFNGTLFAYGQTGSGKTHSMMGSSADPGIVPRTCSAIFDTLAQPEVQQTLRDGGSSTKVSASYLQLYCEQLHDLLQSGSLNDATSPDRDHKKDLKIRRGADGIYVENLTAVPLSSAAQLNDLIEQGNKKRATSATLMNAASSRSHAVVLLYLDGHFAPTEKHPKGRRFHAKLCLVDLAGSERVQKSGAQGDQLKEAIAINQSLSTLGTVINALTDQVHASHVPYRSSKLTHLLEDSLGGNSHTVMLAACSPSHRSYFETLNTMQYAARAKLIICQPKTQKEAEPEPKPDERASVRERISKKVFDYMPRYLRAGMEMHASHGAPRRTWLTGAEQRERVLEKSPKPVQV